MKRWTETEEVDSDHRGHGTWEREHSRPIARCYQAASFVRLILTMTAGVGGIALVVHRVYFLGESRRTIVAPATEVGFDKTAHDRIHWNGELGAHTADTGSGHLRGVSRQFEIKQSLERVRRNTVPGGGENQLADLSGNIQDSGSSVSSAVDPARDSAVHVAIGFISDDRPRTVYPADGTVAETVVDPSITSHVSAFEEVAVTTGATALEAPAGVKHGENKGRGYGKQQGQLLKRISVEPAAAAMTPAQLALKDQENWPLIENIQDQWPEQRLELGNVKEQKQGEGGNQQQRRLHELNLLGQPQGEKPQQEQEHNQDGVKRQQQQFQQQDRQQQQQQQQERKRAPADLQAQLKSQIEDVQDQQVEQEQSQEHQYQQQQQQQQQQQPTETYQNDQQGKHLGHPESADEQAGVTGPTLAETAPSAPLYDFPQGVAALWSRLLEASSSHRACLNPPCKQGEHMHTDFADLGEGMARVRQAVVARKSVLTQKSNLQTAANKLDFTKTLYSYSAIFRDYLFPSDLLETKGLADATDPPSGVNLEGTDAVEPIPAQAAWDTVPDRVHMPRASNDLKEDVSRLSPVVSAVAGDRSAPRRPSLVEAGMHQAQDYPVEEENLASSFINDFVEWNRRDGGAWGENVEHGSGDGSSLLDETAARYRDPEVKEEEEKTEVEVEGEEEGEEDRASNALYFSSYSGWSRKRDELEEHDEQYSSARSWSSFTYFLDQSETENTGGRDNTEAALEAETEAFLPRLHDTNHPQPMFAEEPGDKQSGRDRREVAAQGDEGVDYQYSFESSTSDDLLYYVPREQDEGGGGEGEGATARYELGSDYDVYFTTETTLPWVRQRKIAPRADPTTLEAGHLAGKLLDVLSLDKETASGAERAEDNVFGYALPAPALETQRKLRHKPSHDIVEG